MSSSIAGSTTNAHMSHLAALQAAAVAQAPQPAQAARAAAPMASTASAPAHEASLWDVLTADEKNFFAQQVQMGPLTYGPRSRSATALAAPSSPRGQRVDVRG